MKTALVILNWNGQKLLEKFIPNILKYSSLKNVDIYVADNASTDNSVSFLRTNFPEIKIISNKANYGYAKGYNEALKHIDADIFGLINSDIEVTQDWLKPILNEFIISTKTSIIQPKILDYNSKTHFEYAGAAGGYIDKYGYPFCRGRIFHTIEKDTNQYSDTENIFWASGACLFIRSEVFKTLNGFDEDFFAHQEELDLCWRSYNLNYQTKYIGKSVVFHVGGATLNNSNSYKTYLNFRNNLCMLVKNLPKNKLFKIILSRLLLDGLAGIQYLLKFNFNNAFAIIKAHFSFYSSFLKMYKKRASLQKEDYFQTSSIILNYFIKKKRTYKEL